MVKLAMSSFLALSSGASAACASNSLMLWAVFCDTILADFSGSAMAALLYVVGIEMGKRVNKFSSVCGKRNIRL